MKRILVWAFLATIGACSSTGGTETDNPASLLKGFDGSECKSRESSQGANALTLASDVAGLECVEWELQASGDLVVKLHNASEGCAEGYLGHAELNDDGGLDLSVFRTSCDTLKCGSCLYDFDYRLSGVATHAPLALRLGRARCKGEPVTFDAALTLPLDEQPSGIVCKSANLWSLKSYAGHHGSCGQPNMPCGDCAEDVSACSEGLVCTPFTEDDSRCLTSCETNDDCVANLTCEAGVCRPAASF